MKINRIEVTNYKSFKDKTEVILDKNCNLVVGKNGSGKSNFMSAIHMIVCCPRLVERQDLIHEGCGESCLIEIEFDNSSQRFHGPKVFSIKRKISPSKDEFFVEGRACSREEVKGLFESSGIPVSSPYFMVPQGKIMNMALMNDRERYSLIKNVAGVSKYEEDREKSLEMLEETRHTQRKVEGILERIEDKLGGLEKDKRLLEECEALEKEKRRCEMGVMQREILDLNKSIKELGDLNEESSEECSDEVEDLEFELREVRKEIEEALKGEVKERNKLVSQETEKRLREVEEKRLREIEEKIQSTFMQIQNTKERKKKVEEIYEKNFVELQALKMLKEFTSKGSLPEYEEDDKEEDKEENKEDDLNLQEVSIKDLVEKRNEFWREERSLKGDLKGIENSLHLLGNKLILSGKSLAPLDGEGVLGYVLDLFEVPEELMTAFEAVAGNYFFNIVVEDEGVAARLSKALPQGTFIPLNRMFFHSEPSKEVEDVDNLFLLSSQIKCDNKFKALLSYITRNSFVCSDLKSSNFYSQKFGLNIVTLDGDVFNSSGVISGGYEKKKEVLLDYKKQTKERERITNKLREVQRQISLLNSKIDLLSSTSQDESVPREGLGKKIMSRFMQEKKGIKKEHKSKDQIIRRIKDLTLKLPTIKGEEETLSSSISDLSEKLLRYNKIFLDLQDQVPKDPTLQQDVKGLKAREGILMEALKKAALVKIEKVEDMEKEKQRAKRHVLYSKRLDLMRKIGVQDHKEVKDLIYPELDLTGLMGLLKKIQHDLKKYATINRRALHQWNSYIDQQRSLKDRLLELKANLQNIRSFIEDLDGKKQQFLEFTLEMFRNNFKYFSGRLWKELDLEKEEERLGITHKGSPLDLNLLSGGQKTMIALCLIFSIQKIDPSPFYVFDEADANLDKQGRERISELFKEIAQEENVQFIISTFKEELLSCGNKFIGVSFKDKKSHAGEVPREVVYEFLTDA